jgi:acyl carrier protein
LFTKDSDHDSAKWLRVHVIPDQGVITDLKDTDIVEKLSQFIRSELLARPDYPLGRDQALITGGLIDSFSLAIIGVFIEQAFGVYIPDNDLTVAQMDTLDQMATRIKAGMDS